MKTIIELSMPKFYKNYLISGELTGIQPEELNILKEILSVHGVTKEDFVQFSDSLHNEMYTYIFVVS